MVKNVITKVDRKIDIMLVKKNRHLFGKLPK
jgi:hypothetical protein